VGYRVKVPPEGVNLSGGSAKLTTAPPVKTAAYPRSGDTRLGGSKRKNENTVKNVQDQIARRWQKHRILRIYE
jgi:hypothetical protein